VGRPKRVELIGATDELFHRVDRLLAFANKYRQWPARPPLAEELLVELKCLQENVHNLAPGANMRQRIVSGVGAADATLSSAGKIDAQPWPYELDVDFANLQSLAQAAALYLRSCERCGDWFRSRDKRQRICKADECEALAASERAKQSRTLERQRQKRVRELVRPRPK
jgi:hypothetical protein